MRLSIRLRATAPAGSGRVRIRRGTAGAGDDVAACGQLTRFCSICADSARREPKMRLFSSLSERSWKP